MRIRSLSLRGWRNLAPSVLVPGPRATVLHGDNGQGKTNVIEAIFYLASFRSFRTSSTADLVGWQEPAVRLEAGIETGGLERKLVADVTRERKQFRLDGKVVHRAAPALAGVATVLFVPEDLLLPRAAPSERRRFLDLAIFGVDRGYFREAQEYQKLVRSRNVLLRQEAVKPVLLDTLDEQLARAGAVIVRKRRAITRALAPRVNRLFREIHADLDAHMEYAGHDSLRDRESAAEIENGLLVGLRQRRELDLRRGHTGFGPHGDDLALSLAGHPARQHGSQGQLRSLVLALKLAELDNITGALGEPPVLLLDDVASELDGLRRQRLFETIARLPGQTLITVTDPDFLPFLPERIDYRVRAGAIQPAGAP